MDLYYCKIDGGNFGDDMNAWFWDEVFPDFRDIAPDYTMFGIGSILGKYFLKDHDKVVVMGSGTGYTAFPDDLPGERVFGWVRGPLTAQNLHLAADRAITDPAVMCPRLAPFRDIAKIRKGRLFIPHVGTERADLDWAGIAVRAGLEHVSPTMESKGIIRRIAEAEFVVTESLHGAIVADAFRTPWVGIAISPTFSSYKWEDWARSMEVDLRLAPALQGPKSAYATLRRLRAALRGKPQARDAKGGRRRLPKGELQSENLEYRLRKSEKASARGWVSWMRPFLERRLVRDLQNAARMEPHLSSAEVLQDRQDRILARIEEMRAHLRSRS